MCLVSTVLENIDTEHFLHHKKVLVSSFVLEGMINLNSYWKYSKVSQGIFNISPFKK